MQTHEHTHTNTSTHTQTYIQLYMHACTKGRRYRRNREPIPRFQNLEPPLARQNDIFGMLKVAGFLVPPPIQMFWTGTYFCCYYNDIVLADFKSLSFMPIASKFVDQSFED